MAERPKRRKHKDNPYTLEFVEEKNSYRVSFKDVKGKFRRIEVNKEIYQAFDRFELDDLSELNEFDNHIEHSEVYENNLNERAMDKPLGVDEIVENNNKNHRRSEAITAINNAFFQGVMSTSWYIDITDMFEKYQFEEEVMLALFKYCYDKHALHKNYLTTVAEDWFLNKVRNVHDLDAYYMKREKTNKIKKQIAKKMGIMRNLTEYEEAYIEKWTNEFGYDFAAIEVALKKTTAKTNPNFDYLNGIFRNWNEKGLKSKAEIEEYLKQNKDKQKLIKDNSVQGAKPSSAYINPEQTEFNDLDRFYSNM